MNLQDVRRQAKALLDDIDTTRDRAIGLGMPDHEAGKIGADAEETARNCIALLDMIEDMNARSPAADPVLVLAVDIITRAPGVPVSMGDVVKLCDGLKHAFNKYKAREEAELSYPVEARTPFDPEDFGDPDEPVRSTPVEDDAALPVVKKRRAAEVLKPIAEWELSGADFRALPFDRAWVEAQLPAFRAEQGEGSAARPRVVFAAWLGKREGAGEHKRADGAT